MPCARSSAPSLVALFVVILGGLDLIYSGLYDVGATAPHWAVTRWVLETARTRSIKAHAAGIEAPARLDDPAKILTGVAHFAAHCAVCHGAPGVPKGDIAKGLNPQPPDLAYASAHYTAPELFWILQHGIKMTGMPAWNDHSDAELWATVAVLQTLPGMSDEDYGTGNGNDGARRCSAPPPTLADKSANSSWKWVAPVSKKPPKPAD